MAVTIHSSVDELPAWDEVAGPAGFYSSAGWHRLVHQPGTQYLAVRDAGGVLGVVSCFLAREHGVLPAFSDPAHLFETGAPAAADAPLPALPVDVLYPVLFCGAVRGYTNRLLVRAGLDPAARRAVLGELVAAARALGQREGARLVAFGYLPAGEAQELVELEPGRLRALFSESEAYVGPLVAFETYMTEMKSHRRNQTKRLMRRFADSGLRIDQRRLSDVMLPLGELIAAHERHHGAPCTTQEMVDDFELRISLGLEDQIRIFCTWQGDKLVGGTLFFVQGTTMYSREFAADFEVPREAGVYFNCSYYEPMRVAFEAGMTEIHYGLGALDAKVWRGCRLRPLLFVLDPVTPWPMDVSVAAVAATRERLAAEIAILGQYHEEPRVRAELELDVLEGLIDHVIDGA